VSDGADKKKILAFAKEAIETEAEAVAGLASALDDGFVRAVESMLSCPGRVITMGVGKSGHVARKLAATLASTGTPAFFLSPTDAYHGDSGMVTGADCVLILSHSGEADELTRLIPVLKGIGARLIVMTGDPASTLSRAAEAVVRVPVVREACPHNLAPTASTTAALAMGDALAICLLQLRGFTSEEFAKFHPGGSLGERLRLRVSQVMRSGDDMPTVKVGASLSCAIERMTAVGNLGLVVVLDGRGRLVGIVTDGDLRRLIGQSDSPLEQPLEAVMTKAPKTIEPDRLAAEAVERMERHGITALVVAGEDGKPAGVIHLHDCLGRKEFYFKL